MTTQNRLRGSEANRLKALRELAPVMQRARELHDRGGSYRQIADIVNREGLRTRNGRLWIHATIYQLLNRDKAHAKNRRYRAKKM